MDIVVFSKAQCPNCDAAKKLLDDNGLDFIERSIDDPAWRDVFTRSYPDVRQMPQIFVNGSRIGGLEGLRTYLPQIVKGK